jgi:ferredoxin
MRIIVDCGKGMVFDLNHYLKVRLHIMDGITAMEGNGPMNGDSVQMNCILISTDPVALDAVFCRIIGLDPYLVPTNKFGEEFGLGNAKESDIEILGGGISALVNDKYKVDRSVKKTAKRPVIIKEKCKRCGLCIDSCPVDGKALRFPNEDRAKVPIYDYDKCIRCYCCQELCPEIRVSDTISSFRRDLCCSERELYTRRFALTILLFLLQSIFC